MVYMVLFVVFYICSAIFYIGAILNFSTIILSTTLILMAIDFVLIIILCFRDLLNPERLWISDSDHSWIAVLNKVIGRDVTQEYKELSKKIEDECITQRFLEKCERTYSIPTENVKDKEVSDAIKEINSLVSTIYSAYPDITSLAEKVLDCYVPEIIELVTRYTELTNNSVQTNNSKMAISEIKTLIKDFKNAIEKQIHDQTDISTLPVISDINALKTKMKMDGFIQ